MFLELVRSNDISFPSNVHILDSPIHLVRPTHRRVLKRHCKLIDI